MGRGLIVVDIDNDGAPDLVTTEIAGPARVFRNVAPAAGNWLAVRVMLPNPDRDAVGAEITVRAGGREFHRIAQPCYSYCCSNDPRVFFGLGHAAKFEEIAVKWPDGSVETFSGGPADRQLVVRRGEGKRTQARVRP